MQGSNSTNTGNSAAPDTDTDSGTANSPKKTEGIDWRQVALSFKDPTNYASAVLFFIVNVTYASLPVYLPTILSEAGFGAVRAQGKSYLRDHTYVPRVTDHLYFNTQLSILNH